MPFILAERSQHFGGTVLPVYQSTGCHIPAKFHCHVNLNSHPYYTNGHCLIPSSLLDTGISCTVNMKVSTQIQLKVWTAVLNKNYSLVASNCITWGRSWLRNGCSWSMAEAGLWNGGSHG